MGSKRSMRSSSCSNSVAFDNVLTTVLIVLLLLTAAFILYQLYGGGSRYEAFSDGTKNVLYFFMMTGCPWCDKLKPDLEKIRNTHGTDAAFSRLVSRVQAVTLPTDKSEDQQLAQDFSVQAFPTIILSREDKSKFWMYSASDRSAAAITQWVRDTLASQ